MQHDPSTDWWDVSEDPDPTDDLGYEVVELDVISTNTNGENRALVLPTDEDLLAEDAFMIVDEASVRDLGTVR
ncbi:hypothetical protein JCM30237_25220 [Halolamina litorea]|uniref:Uncharacterized protein n=1 Tax=Halolamina litorea TaxID=1515593 RepID=A0ABD6BUZ7_9EURY|nr:hypothetical protein [Halolamina litorea]